MIINTPKALETALNRLAKVNAAIAEHDASFKKKADALAMQHQQAKEKLLRNANDLQAKITDYAQANRQELTNGGKSFQVGAYCIKWRKSRPSVQIQGDPKSIISELKRRRLARWLVVETKISKAAILADADTLKRRPIDGISIKDDGEENIIIQAG